MSQTSEDYLSTDLSELEAYSEAEWYSWITAFLKGGASDSDPLLGDEEKDQVLIGVYRQLRAPEPFLTALDNILSGTLPGKGNSEELFHLLQSISVIRPAKCRATLQRQLEERRYEDLQHREYPLDQLALSVRCDFSYDQALIDFLVSSFERRTDLGYRLLCVRQLSRQDETRAFELMERCLPSLLAEDSAALGRVLQGISWRKSFRTMYEWYVDFETRTLQEQNLTNQIRETLLRFVAPPGEYQDSYQGLLSARLRAPSSPLAAEEIVTIARFLRDPRLSEDKSAIVSTLRKIWHDNLKLVREFSTGESRFPWLERETQNQGRPAHLIETHWKVEALSLQRDQAVRQDVILDAESDSETVAIILAATGPSNLIALDEWNIA